MSTPYPTGGGIGQAASELLREMQKAQADVSTEAKQPAKPSPGFQAAMQQEMSQTHQRASSDAATKTAAGRVQSDSVVSDLIKKERRREKLASTKVGATARTEENRLTKMLAGLLSGQDKMTKIMNMALSGRQFSPGELLAMQAGVYRFGQELDLTTKVVEKFTGGIKQTLNTQV